MVAKIATGNSLFGALSYNQLKINDGKAKIILSNKMYGGIDEELSIQNCMAAFELLMPARFRTEKPILHISLNPHPSDIIKEEQYVDIAKEYMDRMGYGNQPYIVYKHEDIDRHHLHIISTNVDSNGKKLNSNNDFYRSKKITRDLEQKYGLKAAERTKNNEQKSFNYKKVDVTQNNIKEQIRSVIKPISTIYKFQSIGEYRTMLSMYNICVEEVKGERNGYKYEGLIYYATNDMGEKASNPFKSSLYGKNVGYSNILAKCDKHKQTIKDKKLTRESATRIKNITNGIYNKQSYIEALKKENIDIVFRENKHGRIYGITFIDNNNYCIFNGSRLGKEFSANAINERFSTNIEEQQTNLNSEFPQELKSNNEIYSDFSLGGLFDLPIDTSDDSYQEDSFRWNMQRRKKKKSKKI